MKQPSHKQPHCQIVVILTRRTEVKIKEKISLNLEDEKELQMQMGCQE
jgi:hypothetical protein